MVVTLIVVLVVVAFVLLTLARTIRIVPQARAGVVERFGRYSRTLSAGLTIVVPFVDRIRDMIDLREQVVSFAPQPVITEDNLVVSIDTVIYFQVTEPKAATYEVANYIQAIEQLTVTTLRNVIGGLDLEQTLTSRDQINAQLRGVLDEATGKWGIRVNRVELKAIDPPASVQESMEKQMRADRDKRAAILNAEGVKQSQILEAEGEKQSAILRAEGRRQAQILEAEGEAKAIDTVFRAIHDGKPDSELLAYQYVQALPEIANGEANKVWIIPSEFTQALGQLYRQGWRPARTIVYASWDAEEPSLLGSTEWVETHADELKRKALLYINTDSNGRGYLSAEGSQDLQHFVAAAANDVLDPQTGVPVATRARARVLADNYSDPADAKPDLVENAKSGGDLPMAAVGAGSDYSPFVQHLGIPSINLGFGGEESSGGGSYHSAYDTYYHVMHFDDPGLAYGAALSKVVGRLVMRSADGSRVPARYSDFARSVSRYTDEVIKLAADQREKDRALADLRGQGVFKLASAPTDPTIAPADKGITPLIDMLPLQNAVDHLKRAAAAADAVVGRESALPPATQARIDAGLADIDQLLIDPQGLPGRPWYKNLIYAPGTLTGYGAKTLPGVREAIEQRRFDDARTYVTRTAAVIENYADRLDQVAAMGRTTP